MSLHLSTGEIIRKDVSENCLAEEFVDSDTSPVQRLATNRLLPIFLPFLQREQCWRIAGEVHKARPDFRHVVLRCWGCCLPQDNTDVSAVVVTSQDVQPPAFLPPLRFVSLCFRFGCCLCVFLLALRISYLFKTICLYVFDVFVFGFAFLQSCTLKVTRKIIAPRHVSACRVPRVCFLWRHNSLSSNLWFVFVSPMLHKMWA